MLVVKDFMKFMFILTVLVISLLLFSVSLPVVNAESFLVDVYETDTDPRYVDEGEEVTLSGKVKLVDAPSGYHMVSIEWYVDDNLEHTATHSMRNGQIKSVSWDLDTSDFSFGSHDVKINATVDNVSDVDSNVFFIEEEIELNLDDFDVYPSIVCVDEDEIVELSIEVTLEEGPDDTDVVAKFYIKEEDSWNFIDKEDRTIDEDDEKTFSVEYDYDADSLEEGSHKVKVVVEAGDETVVEYEDLDVEECFPMDGDIEVGWITINPEFPETGDIVLASVPIRLQISRTLPEDVFVKGYVDGRLTDSTTMEFKHLVEKTFTFTVDTRDYSRGTHTIEVKATVDSVTDTSRRTFTLSSEEISEGIHCLNVDLENEGLRPGEDSMVFVEVSNCGSVTEKNIKVKLEAFSRIYYSDIFSISPSRSQEAKITIRVPEDAEDTYTFSTRVWNSYTSDSTSKDFSIETGIPVLEIEPEYRVEKCKTNEITFVLKNIGQGSDTFSLSTDSSWITGLPEEVALEKDEMESIKTHVTVPCDTEEGYYSFTITAQNSKKHSVKSNLYVSKPLAWPSFPSGWFVGIQPIAVLIGLILIFVFIVSYLFYKQFVLSRKRPMFE